MSELGDVSRKLVAVFAADVEGYSRLMGANEVGTLKGLTERRAILDRLIGEHRGRIANTAGDSVLAEFGSAVEAVQCAVEAQTALAEANSSLAPNRRILCAAPSYLARRGEPKHPEELLTHDCIALRENDSKSRDEINFLLQDQWKDGTWQKAFDKWLGKDSKLKMTLADFDDFKMPVWDE